MRLHWPSTDQFINDNIFTLINSKGSLYQRKGFPSPSLLEHRSTGAVQGKAGGSELSEQQSSSRADCSECPALLRQGELPSMALALRDEAGRVGIGHAGDSQQGKSVNIQNFFYRLPWLTMLCIQQLKHQSEAVESDFFCMGTLHCFLSNWECGGAAN